MFRKQNLNNLINRALAVFRKEPTLRIWRILVLLVCLTAACFAQLFISALLQPTQFDIWQTNRWDKIPLVFHATYAPVGSTDTVLDVFNWGDQVMVTYKGTTFVEPIEGPQMDTPFLLRQNGEIRIALETNLAVIASQQSHIMMVLYNTSDLKPLVTNPDQEYPPGLPTPEVH